MSMMTRTRDRAGADRPEPEKKQSVATRLNWLRAGVLGANDGIVSISGLLVGVAAADPTNTKAIAIAGVAGIISAALSMSVGEYVSVSTQRDTERQLVRTQQALLESDPVGQEHRLADLWVERGVSPETAARVAKELSAHDALDAHLTTEHNIDPDDLTNPWAAAFSSFVAFLVGSLLPLATMLLFPPVDPHPRDLRRRPRRPRAHGLGVGDPRRGPARTRRRPPPHRRWRRHGPHLRGRPPLRRQRLILRLDRIRPAHGVHERGGRPSRRVPW